VKTQCSILGSALGSLTESPLKALQGNQDGTAFYRLTAVAASATPALCAFSCTQLSGDGITDVLNYFNYVIGHSWDFKSGDGEYGQTDTIDPDTLEATSATVDVDTFPGGFNGPLGPVWNLQFGYFSPKPPDPSTFTSTSGGAWDKTPTRTGIIAALDGVNWAALWADGTSANNFFQYDRAQISPNQSGRLPFGGTGTGALIGNNVPLGPVLARSGKVGDLVDASSTSDSLGVSLQRTQIQIRNFDGTPVPYFIYETAAGFGKVVVLGNPGSTVRAPESTALADERDVYRKLSDGFWTHDLQIIQLPDAAMDGPGTFNTSAGTRAYNGTLIGMVVGMTFEFWMESQFGPAWADFLWL
jgi:hypothetical protein